MFFNLSYGEFVRLGKLDQSSDTFRLWLLMHTLPPRLGAAVVRKLSNEQA